MEIEFDEAGNPWLAFSGILVAPLSRAQWVAYLETLAELCRL